MAQWDDQLDKLKQIIEIMKEHNLVEVQIKQGDDEIAVKKGQPQQPQITHVPVIGTGIPAVLPQAAAIPPSQTQSAVTPQQEKLAEIKSPLVGTFYARPSPDSEPFAEVGSHVESDTVVCIIEAMKVMNEIKAEYAGTIAEVVAISGEAVEFDQVLFRIRPD
jgi:acetyl-CoA carboxylase biotin carboxyl carrier protein